jgi:hypothetical protein
MINSAARLCCERLPQMKCSNYSACIRRLYLNNTEVELKKCFIYAPQLWRLVLLLLYSHYYLHQMGINKRLQATSVAVAFVTRAQASATLHHSPTSLVSMFFTATSVSICAITAVTTMTKF